MMFEENIWVVVIVTLSLLIVLGALVWMIRAQMSMGEKLWSLFCLLPIGGIALFYSFVLRARLQLRYWPAPYKPDPKELALTVHHLAVWLSFPVIIASMVTFVVIVLARGRRYGHLLRWRILAMGYVVTGVGWLVALRVDPGHFLVWFVD